ncbi:MAG: transposase, partial [bacterium]|nr:transposase [bacterium]
MLGPERLKDPKLAQEALDEVRRDMMRSLDAKERKPLRKSRWALLLKRADTLSSEQEVKISEIQRFNQPLYRAYLLNKSLLEFFDAPDIHA